MTGLFLAAGYKFSLHEHINRLTRYPGQRGCCGYKQTHFRMIVPAGRICVPGVVNDFPSLSFHFICGAHGNSHYIMRISSLC